MPIRLQKNSQAQNSILTAPPPPVIQGQEFRFAEAIGAMRHTVPGIMHRESASVVWMQQTGSVWSLGQPEPATRHRVGQAHGTRCD